MEFHSNQNILGFLQKPHIFHLILRSHFVYHIILITYDVVRIKIFSRNVILDSLKVWNNQNQLQHLDFLVFFLLIFFTFSWVCLISNISWVTFSNNCSTFISAFAEASINWILICEANKNASSCSTIRLFELSHLFPTKMQLTPWQFSLISANHCLHCDQIFIGPASVASGPLFFLNKGRFLNFRFIDIYIYGIIRGPIINSLKINIATSYRLYNTASIWPKLLLKHFF